MNIPIADQYDILVVGSGLAGLRAARDCLDSGLQILHVTKEGFCSGSSFYPLTRSLGSQLPSSEEDKPDYVQELLDSGAGMASPSMCRILVDEITGQIERLPSIGIDFQAYSGRAACFAKKERQLRGWGDWPKIRKNAREIFAGFSNYTRIEHCDLLKVCKRDGAVCGAVLCDLEQKLHYVKTKAVILCTGGLCGLYKYNLNAADVCGMGHSVALDAGAQLVNMEFLQFIPGLTTPAKGVLFHEFTLMHCTDATDEAGNPMLPPILPEGMTQEECLQARAMHGPFTTADSSFYFEQAIMAQAEKDSDFPGVFLTYSPQIAQDENPYMQMSYSFFNSKGIDLAKDRISILPFAHCANGGILIDENGWTGVAGLYAAGEAAGGLHGADRHGGVATAACQVFGARAAKAAVAYAQTADPASIGEAEALEAFRQWGSSGSTVSAAGLSALQKELGEKLWLYAGVTRQEQRLAELLEWIRSHEIAVDPQELRKSAMLRHALRTSEALILAMLQRRESRGPHYRKDFPAQDAAMAASRVVIREENGLKADWIPTPKD